MHGSEIIPGPDPQDIPSTTTNITTQTSSASPTVDISAVETWLDKKEAYEIGLGQAKKKFFMSVGKPLLATSL